MSEHTVYGWQLSMPESADKVWHFVVTLGDGAVLIEFIGSEAGTVVDRDQGETALILDMAATRINALERDGWGTEVGPVRFSVPRRVALDAQFSSSQGDGAADQIRRGFYRACCTR